MATVDIEFEKDVLAASLKDPRFARSALPVLRAHDFSTKVLAWVWKVIEEVYGKNRELPTGKIFVTFAERDFETPKDVDFALAVVLGLRKRKPSAPRTALEQIREFIRLAACREAADLSLEGLDEGDVDKAEAALSEGIRRAKSATMIEDPVDWIETAAERLDRYVAPEGRENRIRFPLPEITAATNGGGKPGSLTIVAANTGVGKTTFAVDCGFGGLCHARAIVIHVTTEETEEECEIRYDARLTGIDRTKFETGDLSEADKAHFLAKFKRRGDLAGRLKIVELPPDSPFSLVRVHVEQVREEYPDDPIFLVVDSPDHLTKSTQAENFRLAQTGVFWEFKALLVDPTLAPVIGLATVQAVKETAGKKVIRPEDLAETYNKSRIASVVIGMIEGDEVPASPGESEPEARAFEFWVGKNRLGRRKRFRVHAEGRLGICEFTETAAGAGPEEATA